MRNPGTLLLSQSEISDLLPLKDCINFVEEAFRLHAQGHSLKPTMMQINSGDGDFHIKAGGISFESHYFCLKANGSFFSNKKS